MSESHTLKWTTPVPPTQLDGLETPPHTPSSDPAFGPDMAADDLAMPFRHSGWADRRRCVRAALGKLIDAAKRRERFDRCGRNAWVMRSLDDPEAYRIACDKCKDRFCTPCATQRARHIADCVGDFAEGKDLRLVTLTLAKSDRSVREDLNRLYAAFGKLRRRAPWTQTQRGGVYFVEIKRRRSEDGWHTHLHVLTEGRWLSKSWLSSAWWDLTGDSYIVDIRQCRSGRDAARYVAKYAGKGVHGSCYHDPDVLLEAIRALRGRRLVGKWGTWGTLDLDSRDPEGCWERVCTLQVLLEGAHRGDTEARMILDAITGEPPSDNPSRAPPQCQGALFLEPAVRHEWYSRFPF